MPSKRTLIKLVTNQWNKLFQRRQIMHVARRALPDDFAQRLIEGIEREREAILERLDVIDASMATLQERKAELTEQAQAAHQPISGRGVRVTTPESVKLRQAILRADRHLHAFQHERVGRLGELSELKRLERQAYAGVTSALLAVAEHFRTRPVLLGGLAERVKGPSHLWGKPCDAAGNELPPEALDENGKPVLHGGVIRRPEATPPLTVES